ncbi:SPOR domain-containing protein [Pikeienuella sp. HZG-20]|uniref:SPOR domain-containing protein n=1 Tax=Paludibacillus litoralis TaxID=3133267 RepID=UPI0030EB3A61
MRDDSYLEAGAAAKAAARKWRNGAVTAAGAVVSLAILVAVVTWSYRLGMRDAEDIPVIRAEAGLTKIRPEEPGGQEVAHQDRAVYHALSGGGAEPTTKEAAALAPPPASLTPADKAPASLSPEPAPRPETAPDRALAAAAAEVGGDPDPQAAETGAAAAPDAAEAEAPAEDPLAAAVAAAVAEVIGQDRAENASDQAPRYAPPARARPSPAARVAAAPVEPREAARASAIQIQLGAFESEAVAAAQWEEIKGRNGDLLTGRGRVITSVQSGGRTLWRLRAGPFDEISAAAALCRALQARGEACIVARAR